MPKMLAKIVRPAFIVPTISEIRSPQQLILQLFRLEQNTINSFQLARGLHLCQRHRITARHVCVLADTTRNTTSVTNRNASSAFAAAVNNPNSRFSEDTQNNERPELDSKSTIAAAALADNGKTACIVWANGYQSTFSAEWIRQHDGSPLSFNAVTNQRLANRALTTPDPTLTDLRVDAGENRLYFTTKEDNFSGFIPGKLLAEVEWLRYESQSEARRRVQRAEKLEVVQLPFAVNSNGSAATNEKSAISDEQYQQLLQFRANVCNAIGRDGACVVKSPNSAHLGFLAQLVKTGLGMSMWRSVYGTTFQVRVEPKPDNLAYTNLASYLHHDLPYYESPPGLQLLHAIENNVKGGDLVLVDSVFVAERMSEQYPKQFAVLTRIPVLHQKIYGEINRTKRPTDESVDYAAHFRRYQPMISLNGRGHVVDVRFNVITEGPMIMPREQEQPFLEALRTFYGMLTDEQYQVRWRYSPGDTVVFNNRRMLHARLAFDDTSGRRHLEGCYVNIDEFRSLTICLQKAGICGKDDAGGAELADKRAEHFFEPRVCNGDWL